MLRVDTVVLCAMLLLAHQASGNTPNSNGYQYKSLAGPASEFPSFAPPSLENSAMHSRYYVLPSLTLEDSNKKWTHSFPVDHCEYFGMTVFAKDLDSVTLTFALPSGAEVTANNVTDESLGYGGAGLYPCRTFLFYDPIPSVGEWSITVTSKSSSYPVNVGLIASFYPSDLILQAFVPVENLIVGQSIEIIALLPATTMGLEKTVNSTRSIATVENAISTIYLPDGTEKDLKMEQGPSDSVAKVKRSTNANDLYASFEATLAGTYKNLVQVDGKLSDGTNFIRSLWYMFTVAYPSIEITGKVKGSLRTHEISQREIIDFNIDVNWDGSDLSYRAFAEVWGTSERNEVPVAWISGLVDVEKRNCWFRNCHYIHMQLDSRWLELANAKPPLTLKSITVEELKSFITLSKSETLEVVADDRLTKWSPSLKAEKIEIDWEMKEGYNPHRVKKVDNMTETGQLLILHGYCASRNGFQLQYFDNYLLFDEYNKNYLHDEYARKAYDLINENGTTRLSVYGHSQGGAVALHLYTYYQTPLDASENGRIVQSLGTPYQGCPLAGLLAYLGDLLGIGCGLNEDLTYDGAEQWLSKIPLDKRAEVYYYTTQYPGDAPFFQRYCLLAVQLVLPPDNDGIVEVSRGQLEGGNLVENTEGECHIRDMHYPAQLDNIERSKEVNAKAAR